MWSADHDLDGNYNEVIGTGRGMLISSTKGTWLVGTASEHHILYAYQLYDAQNVFVAMQQVETPYFQPVPPAPSPWTPNAAWHDPNFAGCATNDSQCYMQWALRILGDETHTVNVYGGGYWVFFNNYGGCPGEYCQDAIVDLENLKKGDGVVLYNINTRGVEDPIVIGGSGGAVGAAAAGNPGSWGAAVGAYLGFE